MRACECGNTNFYAHQVSYHDIIVNGKNVYEEDKGIYESENPYGPYTCTNCDTIYGELSELTGEYDDKASSANDTMVEVDKIGQMINNLKNRHTNLSDQERKIGKEMFTIKRKMLKLKNEYGESLKAFIFRYMYERFGIEDMHDANCSFLIFNKTAQFIKVYRINKDFEYVDDMEKVLKKEKLYGNRASSWFSRTRNFYDLEMRDQLKIFGWTFDDAGKATKTRW